MSAFLAFVGGAAGEWNSMNEEARAASAAQAKADKEAAAKIAEEKRDWERWKDEQQWIADREDNKTRDERIQKTNERSEQANRLVPELMSKQKLIPGQLHFLTYGTESGMPRIESVDKPAEGYSFEDGLSIVKQYNPQVKGQGIFYALKPLETDPTKFTITLRDIKDENTKTPLFENQSEAQTAAENETTRLGEEGADNLKATAVPTTDGTGWTYKIEKITDKKDGKPTIASDDQGIEYNTNYYFRNSPKFGPDTGKTAQQRGGEVVTLTPGLNLPTSGEEMGNYVENEDYLIIRRPMGQEGTTARSTQDMTFFFDDFTPDIAEKIIAAKDDVYIARSYTKMKDRLQEVLTNWTIGTSDEIPAGRQLLPLPEVYAERLEKLAELDPTIRQMLRDHPSDGTADMINREIGNPINEPLLSNPAGGATAYANPNFADAYAVERDGVTVYPEAVQQNVMSLAKNSGQQPAYIHRFHEQARAIDGTSSPEATKEAFEGTLANKDILGRYSFRSVRGGRTQYTMPSIIEVGDIQDNLTNFQTDTQRIDALAIAVPSLAVRQAHSTAQVSADAGPESLYVAVTGNDDYGKLQSKLDNANRIQTIDQELQILLKDLEGEVALPNQITLLKKGANYLLNNVMSGVLGDDTVDMNALRQGLTDELNQATQTGDLEAQVAALVRLNTKMQSYAYAAMMDPNGRLSDQDREQAEVATGAEGFTATKDTVLSVSARLSSAANRVSSTINGYRSNDPRRVVATHLYATQISAGMPTNIVQFLKVTGTEQIEQQRSPAQVPNEIQNNLNIIQQNLGGGQQPAVPPADQPDEAI